MEHVRWNTAEQFLNGILSSLFHNYTANLVEQHCRFSEEELELENNISYNQVRTFL